MPRRKPLTEAERPKRLASLADGADYLGVSLKTIRRYISAGKFPAYRLGKRLLRVDLNEVDDMLRKLNTGGPEG